MHKAPSRGWVGNEWNMLRGIKKIMPLLFTIVCLTLGGCSIKKENDLHGREQVEALREEAKDWTSGRYLFTDLKTGEMYQAFSFMYASDGSQIYLHEQVRDEEYHAEYNDGSRIYITDGKTVEIYNTGREDYVSYSRDEPHPYSTGVLLFYENLFVKSSAASSDEQNNITYVYNYDTGKINDSLGTSLSKFITSYTFDKDGDFLFFTQSNSSGGDEYSYRIDVVDVNAIDVIENPMMAE